MSDLKIREPKDLTPEEKKALKIRRNFIAREDGVYKALGSIAFVLFQIALLMLLRDGLTIYFFVALGFLVIVLGGLFISMMVERGVINEAAGSMEKGFSSAMNETGIQMIAESRYYAPYMEQIGIGEKSLPLRIYSHEKSMYIDYYVWTQDGALKFFPKWHKGTVSAKRVTELPETLDISAEYTVTSYAIDDIVCFHKAPAPPSVAQPKGGRKTVLQTRGGAVDYPATAYEVFMKLFPEKARAES